MQNTRLPACARRARSRASASVPVTGLVLLAHLGSGLALLEPLLRDRPEPWLVAALAAGALGAASDARLFLGRAAALGAGGYASPHYRELHRALAAGAGGRP